MTVKWLPSPYCSTGRSLPITDIVLHWMDGTLAATDQEFATGARRVSAHYGIEDSQVHQYVRDADTAWHCGDWAENCRSIGIEFSADPDRPASSATIATGVTLIAGKCREHQISPEHIYIHSKFFNTACPGTLPVAAIIAAVRSQLGHPAAPASPTPTPPSGHRDVAGTAAIQRACHVRADGMFGDETSRAAAAVIRRTMTDVRFLQARVGAYPDGVWGPLSQTSWIIAVRRIQDAIGVVSDGLWGPLSSAAWAAFYARNYKQY